MVKCVGTNADNIRPAQRALQIFKNRKILLLLLLLLFPVETHPEIARKTLQMILPALYRSGQISWNPTVNKMTALTIKCFLVIFSYSFILQLY
jgi:hypothetical protein